VWLVSNVQLVRCCPLSAYLAGGVALDDCMTILHATLTSESDTARSSVVWCGSSAMFSWSGVCLSLSFQPVVFAGPCCRMAGVYSILSTWPRQVICRACSPSSTQWHRQLGVLGVPLGRPTMRPAGEPLWLAAMVLRSNTQQ
jgi:hypothetical protein